MWGPEQEAYLARELTKLHEQTMRGPLSKLLETITVHHHRYRMTRPPPSCHVDVSGVEFIVISISMRG